VEEVGVAVAETTPLASENVSRGLVNWTDEDGIQVTGVFGSGFPAASSTRAVNRAGQGRSTGPRLIVYRSGCVSHAAVPDRWSAADSLPLPNGDVERRLDRDSRKAERCRSRAVASSST
jgi:hypothetical protein